MFRIFKKKKAIPQGQDRRKYVRLAAHHLVRYKIIGLEYKVRGGSDESVLTYAKNISAGGLLFYAKEKIVANTIVELNIIFPFYPQPIKAVATVRRFSELKTGGFDIAAEFATIDEEARAFINNKISKVMEETKEKRG